MDYQAKLRDARSLIDRGQYNLAVVVLGNILENIYLDFYEGVKQNLSLAQQQLLLQREQEYGRTGDRAAREKGFAGLSLGGKGKFFYENKVIEEAERLFNRSFPHFKAFDPRLFRDFRNEATHGRDDQIVDEDEANLFYSQMRVLLLEIGLIQKAEPKVEAVATGGLRSWKENGVIPHDDILGGNLQMDTYAADLWGVARADQHTPAVYREADQFFRQTYLTNSLRALLNDVLKVLNGGAGDRVLQLRTPFGGGKTHTLIGLYHVTKNRAKIVDLLPDLPDPGECAVAAVQCEKFGVREGRVTDDGLQIHTLWGEIAYQLGGAQGYAVLRNYDRNLTAPGGETLTQLLRGLRKPALILLDEVLNHVEAAQTVTVGESTLGRQLMIFLKSLTEAVSGSRNAALVYSLQASVREGLGAESLLTTLDHLVSRVDAKREPVSGAEVMRVVQRRLFKSLGDETAVRQVASAYAESFRKARQSAGGLSHDDQHQIAQDAERFAERVLESYPFHPDLLDLMYHRWGTLASYQRTRGALQFLASVVYDLWDRGRDLQPLIGAGDVPLDGDNARNAFFTQVGERENYSSVLNADLIGSGARAARVDRRIASDSPALQRFRVGTRLATAAMLYSFGSREGEDRGVLESDLIQAATVPGLDRMILTTALNDLRSETLHLHYTGKRYRFDIQPNLNKLIDEEIRKLEGSEVEGRVRKMLESALAGARGAVIWPEHSGMVNDHVPMLQVVYLPFEWDGGLDEAGLHDKLTQWLEYAGSSRRDHKNSLVFAIPGYMARDNSLNAARELMAVEALTRQIRNYNVDQQELKARHTTARERLERGMLSLYDRIALPIPEQTMYSWRFIELQSRNETLLHDRVMGALRDGKHLFDSVTPDKLIALTGLNEAQVIKTADVANWFFSFFGFTRLSTADAVTNAIQRGVQDEKFGYSSVWQLSENGFHFPNREYVYIGRSLRSDEIDLDSGVLLIAEVAREVTYVPPVVIPDEGADDSMPVQPDPQLWPPIIEPPITESKKRFRLIARADKAKVFKVIRAVQNLMDKSDRVTMQIEIVAESNTQFDPVWLRNAVEEPLDEADVDAQTRLE